MTYPVPHTPLPEDDPYRATPQERWTGGDVRTKPGEIHLRTEFLYSAPRPDSVLPPGRTRHPFSRGGYVTATDWPGWPEGFGIDVAANLWRAIASFGDDADLVITIALREPEEQSREKET